MTYKKQSDIHVSVSRHRGPSRQRYVRKQSDVEKRSCEVRKLSRLLRAVGLSKNSVCAILCIIH